jgi:hypothetical protein
MAFLNQTGAVATTLVTHCPDVIGLSIGVGLLTVLVSVTAAASYLVRFTPLCPYCDERMSQAALRGHLLTCPKHLEFWSRKGGDLAPETLVYFQRPSPTI